MRNLVQLFACLGLLLLFMESSVAQIILDRNTAATNRAVSDALGTPISLRETFTGKVDYNIIGNTESPVETPGANCVEESGSSATLNIPVGATIERAYLYWSGSGLEDNSVKLNGTTINSDNTWSFELTYGNTHYGYFFGAVADVKSLVESQGNNPTDYSVTNLRWEDGIIEGTGQDLGYCESGAAYGGWALVIIYSDESLQESTISTFEGFQGFWPEGN